MTGFPSLLRSRSTATVGDAVASTNARDEADSGGITTNATVEKED